MSQIKFVTNEIFTKDSRSLKNRGQVAIEMEAERGTFLHVIQQLNDYPEGQHFIVQIDPLNPETNA